MEALTDAYSYGTRMTKGDEEFSTKGGLGVVSESQTCAWYSLGSRVIFGGGLAGLGLCGNLLTIIIMGQDRKKSPTVRCLFYLAVVDSLVLLEYGFSTVSVISIHWFGNRLLALRYQQTIIAYLIPCAQATNQMSVGLTVLVTWQRYVSVCRPHQASKYGSHKVINVMTIVVVVFVWCFNIPQLFQYQVVYDDPVPGFTVLVTTPLANTKSFSIFYIAFLFLTITYIMPMVGLGVMGLGLVRAMRQAKKSALGNTSATQKAKEELTVSLIVVIAIFMVCQSITPATKICMWVFSKTYYIEIQCGGKVFYFTSWILNALLINSSANFVVYTVCARGFRKKLFNIFQTRNRVNGDIVQSYQLDSERAKTEPTPVSPDD